MHDIRHRFGLRKRTAFSTSGQDGQTNLVSFSTLSLTALSSGTTAFLDGPQNQSRHATRAELLSRAAVLNEVVIMRSSFAEMMRCKRGELFEMQFSSWLHARRLKPLD
jgi:hypothetical protein